MTDGRYPRQVVAVGVGLLVTSALTYAFQVVAARNLTPADFGVFGAMWSLFFLVLIVVYLGLEQRIAATVAGGDHKLGAPGNLGRLGILAVVGAAAVPIAGVVFGPAVSITTWILLGVGAAGYAGVYALRGLASGTRRFWRYGSLFASEAGSRLAVIGLAVLFVPSLVTESFALAMAVAPWMALLLLGWDLRRLGWQPEATSIQLGAVGAIGVANLSLAGLLNMGPVIVASRQSPEAAGVLFAALVIVRVPLYLLQSVTTTLLPYIAGLTASEGVSGARKRVVRVAYGVGALGAVSVVAGYPILEWAARVFFGPDLVLPSNEFVILGLAISAIVAALIVNQLFVVAQRERRLAAAWTTGIVVFLGFALSSDIPRLGTELGMLAGSLTTLVFLTLTAPSSIADPAQASTEEVTGGPID